MISGAMPRPPSVANVMAAIPGWLRMPAPTMLTFPRSSRADHAAPSRASASSAAGRSVTGAENTISGPDCRMVSTFTWASASSAKSAAALGPSIR